MMICNVTARLDSLSLPKDLKGVSFVAVRREDGHVLAAADILGAQPGQQVAVCQGDAAQCILGRRCAVDAAVTAILTEPHR